MAFVVSALYSPWRKVVHGVLRENGPYSSSSERRFLWATFRSRRVAGGRFRDSGDPGGKCDVIGVISTTAWYAAMRGLPRCRGLSDRILIHHSTLSQSRRGSSMSLAKCILSQNVRRVRVCKRHLLPARDRKAPEAADSTGSWWVFRFMVAFHFRCRFG
jgi:hypothetical protein